jgi:hypothetical protein
MICSAGPSASSAAARARGARAPRLQAVDKMLHNYRVQPCCARRAAPRPHINYLFLGLSLIHAC